MNAGHRWIGAAALCVSSFAIGSQARSAELTLPRDGWTSWEVAAVDDAPDWCCWSDDSNFRNTPRTPCRLDRKQNGYGSRDHATTDTARIYVRTASGKIDRLQAFSATCPVETATPIHDLGSVTEDESARWLVDLATQRGGTTAARDIEEGLLAALAINRGDRARDALAGFARNDARVETRKRAVFWLALLRGREGADLTAAVMFNDKSPDVREHAAFSISQSKAPRAAADLIRLGNTDREADVRGQAWFWLAQTAAPEAENAIFAALEKETDEEVCEHAILALSRLPEDRGTRALIATAENQSLSRGLRKRAIFWLSQSESDSAQAYLDRVLTAN